MLDQEKNMNDFKEQLERKIGLMMDGFLKGAICNVSKPQEVTLEDIITAKSRIDGITNFEEFIKQLQIAFTQGEFDKIYGMRNDYLEKGTIMIVYSPK